MKGFVTRPQEKRRLIRRILLAALIIVSILVALLTLGLMLHERTEYLRERRAYFGAEISPDERGAADVLWLTAEDV